ncbi:MAG: pro-sigmaK processing inhibitor BofA family protein [Syntrophomonadaceae bacterium]|jgi:inhibitor of the pro-sigma K processing machinery
MTNIILAGILVLIILYAVAKVFMQPIKLLWKLVINSAVGIILLLIVNYVGAYFDFSLPINIITVLVAGFLGLPGILLLICFQLLMM